MQMFVLSHDPSVSAQYLADVHVRVICREISMCLSSWYYKNIGEHVEELPYRPFNHPVIDQFDNPTQENGISIMQVLFLRNLKDDLIKNTHLKLNIKRFVITVLSMMKSTEHSIISMGYRM